MERCRGRSTTSPGPLSRWGALVHRERRAPTLEGVAIVAQHQGVVKVRGEIGGSREKKTSGNDVSKRHLSKCHPLDGRGGVRVLPSGKWLNMVFASYVTSS